MSTDRVSMFRAMVVARHQATQPELLSVAAMVAAKGWWSVGRAHPDTRLDLERWIADVPSDSGAYVGPAMWFETARCVLGPELWETCGAALTEIAESALLRYGAPL